MYTPTVDKYPDGLVSHPTAGEQINQGNQGDWWIFSFGRKHVFKLREKREFKNFLLIYFVFDQ